ncbi:unnamed protein product [Dibothriocephalus latus]|uniref:Uncharacterized protein n=1 Tax=Dibothriocephalus latus TaxID=60516 RepID=A0A3P7LGL1_DIBLA|nr:unnamed protein product [Dibothriocephalus latus]
MVPTDDTGLDEFVSHSSPESPAFDAPAEDDTLKDELAAQLLLSDSGDDDEGDNNDEADENLSNGGNGDDSGSSECDPTLDPVPADRRQRSDSPTAVEDTHAAAEIVLDDVDVGLGDDVDEDDEFQRGGELLDDPFGPTLSHSEDDELSRDNF